MFSHGFLSRNSLCAVIITMSVTLMLAACGTSAGGATQGGSTSATATPQNTATATPPPAPKITNLSDYCNLVTTAEVATATGLTITQVMPIPNQTRQQVLCGYNSDPTTSSGAGAVILFIVTTDATQAQAGFSQLQQQAQSGGATVTNISGIGDAAFGTSQGGTDSVIVRKGSLVFITSGPTAHPLPLAVDKQLAQLVAGKL